MFNDFVLSFVIILLFRVVSKYCDGITEALHSTPITGASSLLWLRPTLPFASPNLVGIELQLKGISFDEPLSSWKTFCKALWHIKGEASHVPNKSLCTAAAAFMPVCL